MSDWTKIVMRNGASLDVHLPSNAVIAQLTATSEARRKVGGGMSLVHLAAGGQDYLVSAPDIVAIAPLTGAQHAARGQ